jgi:hypothetical protein
MTIKIITPSQPVNADRLLWACCAHADTPAGVYDETIELAVTGAKGYIPRDGLRKIARAELKRRGLGEMQVRAIKRIA